MDGNLTRFDNQESALSYTGGGETLLSPQVSLIKDGLEVVFSKEIPHGSKMKFERDETTGKLYFVVDGVYYSIKEMLFGSVPETSTEYVDLGAAGIWAKCNVGATSPEEYGTYFSWGNTTGGVTMVGNTKISAEQFVNAINAAMGTELTPDNFEEALQEMGMSIDMFTAYISNYSFDPTTYAETAGGTFTGSILDAAHDAATANMGGTVEVNGVIKTWRMPTVDEIQTLIANTTKEPYTVNGVSGMKFTSTTTNYTDKSIFIPFAGNCSGSLLGLEGLNGGVWSSSVDEGGSSYARYLSVNSGGAYSVSYDRFSAMPVRGVVG